jgi:hypothetical protein
MKLLVIGYSVVDKIESMGKAEVKPGGIFYTVLGLNSLKEDKDFITLITAFDKNNHHLFADIYNDCEVIHYYCVDNLPAVNLKIYENAEREEVYENINDPLKVEINNYSNFDGILINMITGFDITLESLYKIRESFSGPIYVDVHTMTRGLTNSMKREFRQIENFSEWAKCIDILQANHLEAKMLCNEKSELDIAKKVLEYGVRIFIITKEQYGARIYFKQKNEIASIFKPALRVDVKNKVGCGDIFGSAFFYIYVKDKNIVEALDIAIQAAGLAASYNSIEEYKNLRYDVFARYH